MFEIIEVGGVKTVSTRSACNHVYVVDVSGSMYSDLPKIRQNTKNIISLVAQEKDTFSMIYFSGRGQCGVVFENVLVSDPTTIDSLHKAIDRFIKPIGATGFVDPIEKAMSLQLDPSKMNNFIMMTDGYNNSNSVSDVMAAVAKLPEKYQSVSFIEYGYYADRELISKMAEATNGNHIFADGMVKYETAVESAIAATPRVNNIEVRVNKAAKHCIFVYNGQIRIVGVVDGIASVPEDVGRVHSIVPKDVLSKQLSVDHLYLVLFYAATQDNSELVWNVLQRLGDVALIKKYANAFTKQELSTFKDMVEAAVLEPEQRFLEGKDTALVPAKNAPTVIELLETLADNDAQLVLSSPYWDYKRTGLAAVAQNELPRFVQSPLSQVSMKGLVFSSERPNVSISTELGGNVELPENDFGLKLVPSKITRNYTIVKDGILNVDKLPVVVESSMEAELAKFNPTIIEAGGGKLYLVFDLTRIPVINRSMVDGVALDSFVETAKQIELKKAELKVIGALITEKGEYTAKIQGMIEAYGAEAAKWLSSIGVRDYGFSPVGTKTAEATDEYESIQVDYKIKGLSSLPAIDAVRKKLDEKKKLTTGDILISEALSKHARVDTSVDELTANKLQLTAEKREDERTMAKYVYALVLGRKWFGDDEVTTTEIDFGSTKAPMDIIKIRKMIKI